MVAIPPGAKVTNVEKLAVLTPPDWARESVPARTTERNKMERKNFFINSK